MIIDALAITVGLFGVVAATDWQKDWQLHDPHKNDRQNREDGAGWTADSINSYIWRGSNGNKPKSECDWKCVLKRGLGLLAIEEIIRQGINCFADGGACVDDAQPSQLVVPTETSTTTPTPNMSVNISLCIPSSLPCPTLPNTPTSTPTATSAHTSTVTPKPAPTIPLSIQEKRLLRKGLLE